VKGILGIVIYNKKAITYINILWRRGEEGELTHAFYVCFTIATMVF